MLVDIDIFLMFFSLTASFVFTLFMQHKFRYGLRQAYKYMAEEIIQKLDLPQNTPHRKIIRMFYILFVLILFSSYSRIEEINMTKELAFFLAIISPPFILLTILSCLFCLFQLIAAIIDFIQFLIYVPHKMYQEREQPSFKQFTTFFGYLFYLFMFLAAFLAAFFP